MKRILPTRIGHKLVEHNGVVFSSGVVADDFAADMGGQTRQVCAKIDALLAEIGLTTEALISTTIFISDFSKKEDMNVAWLGWLRNEIMPTRATIGVATLGKGVLIEVIFTAASK